MIYASICKECVRKYIEVIDKKISKGCFQMVMEVPKEDCSLCNGEED